MKRWFLILVVFFFVTFSGWAETHQVKFYSTVVVNGVELEPGQYELEVNEDNQAELIRKGKVVATSKVEVQPLGDANPGSISHKKDGTLTEIRLEEQRVVFVKS